MNAHAPYLTRDSYSSLTPLKHRVRASMMRVGSLLCMALGVTLISSSVAQARPRQGDKIRRSPPVEFTLIHIGRPLLRRGKRLTTPRRVVLFSSRPPLAHETGVSQGGLPWAGQTMNIFRASPIKVNEAELRAQEEKLLERYRALTATHVQSHYKAISNEAARFVREKVRPMARGSVTVRYDEPHQDAESLEMRRRASEVEEDDDEITPAVDLARVMKAERVVERAAEEGGGELPVNGQLCGGEGEPCCEQGFESPCSPQLSCQAERLLIDGISTERWRCLPAPEPCGGYGQACCVGAEIACLFEGLACSGESPQGGSESGGVCLMPPLPAPERRLKVGEVKVLNVRGQFVEAEVISDRLVGVGIHAVMKGDKGHLRGGR